MNSPTSQTLDKIKEDPIFINETKLIEKKEPPTSYGVVGIHLSGELNKYSNLIKHTFEITQYNIDITKVVDISNIEYRKLYSKVNELLMFLLVSRKHSLGYIEFIKGQYEINDIRKIKHLFLQMTNEEIDLIFKKRFDSIWTSLWGRNARKMSLNREYIISKEKYNELLLRYNINDFKPKFPTKEWGYPKGKKYGNESNISCAIRECSEETSLFKSEINILPGIYPLTENMIGTNGLQYKHIYFIALFENIRLLDLNNENVKFVEIDTAGWFKKDRALNLIRPYHVEKIKIINQIVQFITYMIYCAKQSEIL